MLLVVVNRTIFVTVQSWTSLVDYTHFFQLFMYISCSLLRSRLIAQLVSQLQFFFFHFLFSVWNYALIFLKLLTYLWIFWTVLLPIFFFFFFWFAAALHSQWCFHSLKCNDDVQHEFYDVKEAMCCITSFSSPGLCLEFFRRDSYFLLLRATFLFLFCFFVHLCKFYIF